MEFDEKIISNEIYFRTPISVYLLAFASCVSFSVGTFFLFASFEPKFNSEGLGLLKTVIFFYTLFLITTLYAIIRSVRLKIFEHHLTLERSIPFKSEMNIPYVDIQDHYLGLDSFMVLVLKSGKKIRFPSDVKFENNPFRDEQSIEDVQKFIQKTIEDKKRS